MRIDHETAKSAKPVQQVVASVLIGILAVSLAVGLPGKSIERSADQRIYRETQERMHAGTNYYDAMDSSLRDVNGPASTARSFRLPTIFYVWKFVPSGKPLWVMAMLWFAATSILIVWASSVPWAGLLVFFYMFSLARGRLDGGWDDAFLIVETWALLPMCVVFFAVRKRMTKLAAGAAMCAVAIRELCLPLVGGVWWWLWRKRSDRRVQMVVGVGAVMLGLLAVIQLRGVHGHLVEHGSEEKLLGTGSLRAIADMSAFTLPSVYLAATLIIAGTVMRLRQDRELAQAFGPMFVLPLFGVIANRPYWGILVVPFFLVLSLEWVVAEVAKRRIRETPAS